jgi:hypothetical protein
MVKNVLDVYEGKQGYTLSFDISRPLKHLAIEISSIIAHSSYEEENKINGRWDSIV